MGVSNEGKEERSEEDFAATRDDWFADSQDLTSVLAEQGFEALEQQQKGGAPQYVFTGPPPPPRPQRTCCKTHIPPQDCVTCTRETAFLTVNGMLALWKHQECKQKHGCKLRPGERNVRRRVLSTLQVCWHFL
jgi:hypothetical protein